MFGYNIDQTLVTSKAMQAVHSLRTSFELVETYAAWLANIPVVNDVDPLIAVYGFTTDEAYTMRFFFETMENVRTSNETAFDIGRKITGLMT